MTGKVNSHNVTLFQQIEETDEKEKDADHDRNMAMMAFAAGN